MWDTIQKLEYRVRANITGSKEQLDLRLTDRVKLPLAGLNGENLYLTGMSALRDKAAELDALYTQLPSHRGVKDTIILDVLSESESKLLEWMNKVGLNAEITVKKAAGILQMSENSTRTILSKLVKKGYLTVNTDKAPYIYRLHQHISYP